MRRLVICIHSWRWISTLFIRGGALAEQRQRTGAWLKTSRLQISFLVTVLKLSLSPSRQKKRAARSALARRRRLRPGRNFVKTKMDVLFFLMGRSGFQIARSDIPLALFCWDWPAREMITALVCGLVVLLNVGATNLRSVQYCRCTLVKEQFI